MAPIAGTPASSSKARLRAAGAVLSEEAVPLTPTTGERKVRENAQSKAGQRPLAFSARAGDAAPPYLLVVKI